MTLTTKRQKRSQSLDYLLGLVKRHPGIEQRQLCPLMGCSLQYAKDLVDELIRAGKIERKLNGCVVKLYLFGYSADRGKQAILPKRRWNDCRVYRVPVDDVFLYRNPSIPLPEECRVDREVN